jgi:hypothetical protein
MSLNLERLEKVVDLATGGKQARCPACAESGADRKGEHLRISQEGKFGCCVFPGDREHRKRIFALAGERGRLGIRVRVATATVRGPVQSGILGRLGRALPSAERKVKSADWAGDLSDAPDGVAAIETTSGESRTARTGEMESEERTVEYSRTDRTGSSLLTRNANEMDDANNMKELIESADPVRSVRTEERRLPRLLSDGTLAIPFNSPERYHWWKGGQSVRLTRAELVERKELNASPF